MTPVHEPLLREGFLAVRVILVYSHGMTNHTNCSHPATKAARAACRKARNDATIRPGDNVLVRLDDAPRPFPGVVLAVFSSLPPQGSRLAPMTRYSVRMGRDAMIVAAYDISKA